MTEKEDKITVPDWTKITDFSVDKSELETDSLFLDCNITNANMILSVAAIPTHTHTYTHLTTNTISVNTTSTINIDPNFYWWDDEEKELREKHPVLREAYEEYQLLLKLFEDEEYEKEKK